MNKKMIHVFTPILCLLLLSILTTPSFAADISLDDLIVKIQANQSRIKDMYAETTTTITSNMAMPGQESKGPQKIVQKGKMWTKGGNKSKIEIISPMRQITITNGVMMAIINPDTGQKIVQDMKKARETTGIDSSRQMNLEKAKEHFDFKLTKAEDIYKISGVPKKANAFFGRMEFYIDSERWLPIKILMYDAKNKPMSESKMEYQEISGAWVPAKNISKVNTPMGVMEIDMEYKGAKINQGISDNEFKIE